jgi:hypothetical protein
MTALEGRFPLGAALTLDQLDTEPYGALARLRAREPVSWVPVLGGWLVTRRDLCIEVMRNAAGFTVDDPASPPPRSSGRACCRSTAMSTAATAIRSRVACSSPR